MLIIELSVIVYDNVITFPDTVKSVPSVNTEPFKENVIILLGVFGNVITVPVYALSMYLSVIRKFEIFKQLVP